MIRKYANESGVTNPHLLRTRFLRQHLATETATSNVDNRLGRRIYDFMSHKRKIHEDYYVVTQTNDDIIKLSKLLENFSSTKEHPKSSTSTSLKRRNNSSSEYEPSDQADTDSNEGRSWLYFR